jgi:hypothetical protein
MLRTPPGLRWACPPTRSVRWRWQSARHYRDIAPERQ